MGAIKYYNNSKSIMDSFFQTQARTAYYDKFYEVFHETEGNYSQAFSAMVKMSEKFEKMNNNTLQILNFISQFALFKMIGDKNRNNYTVASHLFDGLSNIRNSMDVNNFPFFSESFSKLGSYYFDLSDSNEIIHKVFIEIAGNVMFGIDDIFNYNGKLFGIHIMFSEFSDPKEHEGASRLVKFIFSGKVLAQTPIDRLDRKINVGDEIWLPIPFQAKFFKDSTIDKPVIEYTEMNKFWEEGSDGAKEIKMRDIKIENYRIDKFVNTIMNIIAYVNSPGYERVDYRETYTTNHIQKLSKKQRKDGKKPKVRSVLNIKSKFTVIGPNTPHVPRNKNGLISKSRKRSVSGRFWVKEHKRLQRYGPRNNPTYKEIVIKGFEKGKQFLALVNKPYLVK